jgi:SAM-dependent methyltransferase
MAGMAFADTDPDRFAFGANWSRFLARLDEDRIAEAVRSVAELVGEDAVRGRRWLDVGSGSGLFSLAAARLGARELRSFDYDADSVACTARLRAGEGVAPERWAVERGSVLDEAYMNGLGTFDVVYAWGVLHHTGALWTAFDRAAAAVAPGGLLVVALYADQGALSHLWRAIKRVYNRLPPALRLPYALAIMGPRELAIAAKDTLATRSPRHYVERWTRYRSARGMSRWHDIVDWVGGYPFEVATPAQVHAHARRHGLVAEREVLGRGHGCHQYVLRRPG